MERMNIEVNICDFFGAEVYKVVETDERGNVVNETLHLTRKGASEHFEARRSFLVGCDIFHTLEIRTAYIDL